MQETLSSKKNLFPSPNKAKNSGLGNSGGTINMSTSKRSLMLNKMEGTMYNPTNPNVKKASEFGIPTLLNSQSCLNVEMAKEEDNTSYLNPEDYFRKVLDPKLLCHKCCRLYTDPIACYKCGKVYCANCLEWELDSHSRCLYCFNIIFKDIAYRVSDDINEDYAKHEVKCPYKKCKEVTKLKDIREHIEDCLYRDDINDINKIEHIEKVVCFDKEVG